MLSARHWFKDIAPTKEPEHIGSETKMNVSGDLDDFVLGPGEEGNSVTFEMVGQPSPAKLPGQIEEALALEDAEGEVVAPMHLRESGFAGL